MAYFEVAKDAAKPFIVKTSRYNIEVLGTHFNVADYENDALVHTTLVEGKVAVSGPGIRQRVLQPNEQFVLDKNTGKQDVKAVDVSYLVSASGMSVWKILCTLSNVGMMLLCFMKIRK